MHDRTAILPAVPPARVHVGDVQLRLSVGCRFWCQARDGDIDARRLFRRHYSYRAYADGRNPKKFVGPGYHLVLLSPDCRALFVWRLFRDKCERQYGVNCAIFRNETEQRSSDMIREAEAWAWRAWPSERRLYTYVNARKVRSTNPGYCFIAAGWLPSGTTKSGLRILEKFRDA